MATATLNVKVAPRRMLSAREAADYCGMPVKHFRADCPVNPVEMPRGLKLFDMRDLDHWLDDLKGGANDTDILERLG
jgi:hypothetical protein